MDTYLDNLVAAATEEKDVLEQLVTINTSLVKQLEVLTTKVQQLSSQSIGLSNTLDVPIINRKCMKFM